MSASGRMRSRRLIALAMATGIVAALVAWVLVPHRWEGPVLFTITSTHGIHQGDLLGAALAVVALVTLAVVTLRDPKR